MGGALIKNNPDIVWQAGVIQIFEVTFELGWKTIKDYLEGEGVIATTPREVIKQAFHYGIITEGEIWLDALKNRNLLTYTYNEKIAQEALQLIEKKYYPRLEELKNFFLAKLWNSP